MDRDAADLVRALETYGTAFEDHLHCHGTAVSLQGQGVLLLGPSGSGKSALALMLVAHGADLIADDGAWVSVRDGTLMLSAPPEAPAMIEARHVGLLAVDCARAPVPLRLAVDLGRDDTRRLPPRRKVAWAGASAELIHGAGQPTLWAVLIQYLRGGRVA
ncbi:MULTISPECIES: HPr kinase/phosphorylase [Rhodophyticola]|jgi:HPr kinase/phosphorylase|uniref:HPr kinase/phosphorylase n=1 Tax=Rhodophyticola TaxID=2680018 RepID=UPI001B2F2BC2|nr:serine kinase [Roseicyclus sp.]MBO6922634.1 serine kinase [Roseicyclus sp.]